jgi:plastocyanin
MTNTYKVLKNSSCLFCSIFLFIGCTSSTSEKKIHKTYTVEIAQMQFQPASLTVQKGDTVVWINHDIVTHDVTEEAGKFWTSGPLDPGKSWSMVVTKSADYYCTIHVVMKGKLVVQ